MQLYFLLFCVFQSNSPESCDEISSWWFLKTNWSVLQVCFSCLLMFYCVYTNSCALKVVNENCYGTCSLVAVCFPEMWIGQANNRKHLTFLRCTQVLGLVLKLCSDINEAIWLQLLVYFVVYLNIVASVVEMSFCPSVFRVLQWGFLVLRFYGNVCIWIPKLLWSKMVLLRGSVLEYGFLPWLHTSVDSTR